MEESIFDGLEYKKVGNFLFYELRNKPLKWTRDRRRKLYKALHPVYEQWSYRDDWLIETVEICKIGKFPRKLFSPDGFSIVQYTESYTYSIIHTSKKELARVNGRGIYVRDEVIRSSSDKYNTLKESLERIAIEIFEADSDKF